MGSQGGFSNGLGYFAYYRIAEAQDTKGSDETEHSYSVGLTYNFGEGNKWQAKIARAENLGLEVDGKDIEGTKDNVTSMQLMYSVDTNAVVYARYAMNDLENTVLLVKVTKAVGSQTALMKRLSVSNTGSNY